MDPRIKDSLPTIEREWTLADVMRAHLVLDALDEAQARADDQAKPRTPHR